MFSVVPLRVCRKFSTAGENNLPLLNTWTDESTKPNEMSHKRARSYMLRKYFSASLTVL